MSSSRPYLVRAIYEWILDNRMAPHLLVNALAAEVTVPTQYVQNGKIILNVSPSAVHKLVLGNEHIEFNARFSGISMNVSVPISAVLAIYARENGQGMVFNENDSGSPAKPLAEKPKNKPNKPKLKLVT